MNVSAQLAPVGRKLIENPQNRYRWASVLRTRLAARKSGRPYWATSTAHTSISSVYLSRSGRPYTIYCLCCCGSGGNDGWL